MENAIQPFKFNEHEVRTITDDKGEPWFVAKDVCNILGLTDTSMFVQGLEEDEKGTSIICTPGGNQTMLTVNESGLYALVFKSRKPEAKAFRRWVTSEVLPTIRRTGGYIQAADNETPEEIMARALIVAKDTIDRKQAKIEEQKAQIEDQQAQIEEAKPKVLFADAVSSSHTCILIGELAKILRQNNIDIGQNRLFQWLRKHGWLIRRQGCDYNMPSQKSIELGLFEIKERAINNPDGTVLITKTTMVTGKGQVYFVNRFLNGAAATA